MVERKKIVVRFFCDKDGFIVGKILQDYFITCRTKPVYINNCKFQFILTDLLPKNGDIWICNFIRDTRPYLLGLGEVFVELSKNGNITNSYPEMLRIKKSLSIILGFLPFIDLTTAEEIARLAEELVITRDISKVKNIFGNMSDLHVAQANFRFHKIDISISQRVRSLKNIYTVICYNRVNYVFKIPISEWKKLLETVIFWAQRG